MPKYYEFMVAGYYLYFTSRCVIECMHVHASDRKLTEEASAKLFVKSNGDTVVQNVGLLNDRELCKIQRIILRTSCLECCSLCLAAHCPASFVQMEARALPWRQRLQAA